MSTLTVSKWGNSLGIRIPAEFLKKSLIKEGDRVNITEKDGIISISKKKTAEDVICEFFNADYDAIKAMNITDEELDWGEDVGEEIIYDQAR